MNNSYSNNNNSYDSNQSSSSSSYTSENQNRRQLQQFVFIPEEELERQSLLKKDNLSYSINKDEIIIINNEDENDQNQSKDSATNPIVLKAKKVVDSFFCKIILIFICLVAIYSLVVIKCDGFRFNNCSP
ncbi:hypothetical protein ACTFIZ_008932 [Dictyostelium cf. discoideum]